MNPAKREILVFYILIVIYFFNYETIVNCVPAFFMHNNLVLARVLHDYSNLQVY